MPTSSTETRLALLRAAERLFAERGVDAVSMREIAATAGQANHSAVLYHFNDKRALLNAVLERHSGPLEQSWRLALNGPGARSHWELEELVDLMVRSVVALLDDKDGGTEYLLVVAELVTSRSFPVTEMPAASAPGIQALTTAMMSRMAPFAVHLMPLRMMRAAAVLYCSISDYHRLTRAGLAIQREDFVADLVASLVGLLGRAPEASAAPSRSPRPDRGPDQHDRRFRGEGNQGACGAPFRADLARVVVIPR